MSGLNHKGPMNNGPMTGRKMGKCTNFGEKLKVNTEGKNSDNQMNTSLTGSINHIGCLNRNRNERGQGGGKGFRHRCGRADN